MALVHERGFSIDVFDESPWYRWLEPTLSEVRKRGQFPTPEHWTELHSEVARAAGVPALRFLPAPAKKVRRRPRNAPIVLGELYEGRIVERHEVPTRLDDWHDFFNALAFIAFPAAKWELHGRQYQRIAARLAPGARRLPGARTREQDALSLLDEGGILVALAEPLAAVLPAAPEAFDQVIRQHFAHGIARAVPFGHALFEHLVLGRSDMLGTLLVVPTAEAAAEPAPFRAALDGALAVLLRDPTQFMEPSAARGFALAELSP